jgi:hypothetical protein
VVVEVLDFEDDTALFRATGLDSALKDKVFRARLVKKDGDLLYALPWGGREWTAIIRSGDSNFIGSYWNLRPPATDITITLTYSEARSAKVDAAAMFAAHTQQEKSGELEQMQRYDRRAETAKEESNLASSAEATARECGTAVKTTIAWDTVDDSALQTHSVSGYCDGALHALRAACATAGGKQFVQQKIQQVTCRLDGKGEMSLNAGQLTWAVSFELSDLDTLANRALAGLSSAEAPGATK